MNNNSYELGPVTMSASLPKGTMSVASLDDQPLDASNRMLLIYTTDSLKSYFMAVWLLFMKADKVPWSG
ncbi:hypothetical protein [Paenibacillus marchantiophytorum]|uniref:hypothetical protein n=1 Tax=Paenibacillus marchantiophytorum TaxID=1619310 RepID=UPI001664D66E|nr:hypothetical protein [Paenibacillus marchantiophytorum]